MQIGRAGISASRHLMCRRTKCGVVLLFRWRCKTFFISEQKVKREPRSSDRKTVCRSKAKERSITCLTLAKALETKDDRKLYPFTGYSPATELGFVVTFCCHGNTSVKAMRSVTESIREENCSSRWVETNKPVIGILYDRSGCGRGFICIRLWGFCDEDWRWSAESLHCCSGGC